MSGQKIRCGARVYGDGRGGTSCSRIGVLISSNGKHYCKQHLPENVKARDAARRARWDVEMKARSERWDREGVERDARTELLEAIRTGQSSDILVAAQRWEEAVRGVETNKANSTKSTTTPEKQDEA